MQKRFIVLMILFQMICLAIAQQSEQIISPGSPLIDGSVITDYTNKWKVTYVTADGAETPNRIWTDYGQLIELNEKQYFHRVQDLYDPNMNLQETWINMTELPSLRPISFTRISTNGKSSYYEFEENKVKGVSNYQSEDFKPSKIDTELEETIFDWNLYGMLLVGLPFEESGSFKLPFYSAQTDSLDWITININQKEKLELSNGNKIEAQKVLTDKGLTFWLTKEAPYVHRLELDLQNKAKLIWETF